MYYPTLINFINYFGNDIKSFYGHIDSTDK